MKDMRGQGGSGYEEVNTLLIDRPYNIIAAQANLVLANKK